MAKIIIVDDDYALEALRENLYFLGHDVKQLRSVADALKDFEALLNSDLVLLDQMMELPESIGNGASGASRSAGLEIYRRIRASNKTLPVIIFSAYVDENITHIVERDIHTQFIHKWSTPSLTSVVSAIEKRLGIDSAPPQIKSFIVHGQDEATKLALKNYLQNTLHLPEPIVLHEHASVGRTLIEKFEHYAYQCSLVFVLLTPDDVVVSADSSNDEKRRARQNVIFELGFFLGVLGRTSGRVILLYISPLELPSDISGVVYINISRGIESAGEEIRREIRHVTETR